MIRVWSLGASRAVAALILVGLLVGCGGGADREGAAVDPGPGEVEDTFADDFAPAPTEDLGGATLAPEATEQGRQPRRLSVDQLRRSIPLLFGGITWTAEVQGRQVNVFDGLSRTLGEADYIQVTESNGEPNPLFAKFMDDMAGQVCSRAVARDDQTAQASARLVAREPGDPDATLRFLRLKLHGVHVPEGSTEGIEELRVLHDDILEDTNDANQAWVGVCVAMLTAPEFMAY